MTECEILLTRGELFWVQGPRGTDPGGMSWELLSDGAIAVGDGAIVAIGSTAELESQWRAPVRLDAAGRLVTPGLIDPHTHLLFGGWRAEEFAARVSGRPVESHLRRGIGATVAATAETADEELAFALRERLLSWLRHGVTTVEIKSGYGLTVDSELRLLRIIEEARAGYPGEIVATALAAHAVPHAFDGTPREYLERVAWPVIEEAHASQLAEYVDVFVERGAFGVPESEEFLRRAAALGLRLRVHGDQLENGGGAALAARVGATSVDHLEHGGEESVRALRGSGVVATLLPGASLTLDGRGAARPRARALLDANVVVALGTDFNPGTSTLSAPSLVPGLASRLFGMTPEEALVGMTAGSAASLDRSDRTGRLAPGLRADLCVWPLSHPADLGYRLDAHRPDIVIARGHPVVGA